MRKETITPINYANATTFKLKNRRVTVVTLKDGYQIELKIMTTKEKVNTPHAGHKNIKDKIVLTGIKISEAAAVALYYALQNEFAKNDLKVEKVTQCQEQKP